MIEAIKIIEKIAEEQQSGDFEICPRCGEKTMREKLHNNCLSRRADVYVCEQCGMDEALHDCSGCADLITEWHAVRAYARCNGRKDIR